MTVIDLHGIRAGSKFVVGNHFAKLSQRKVLLHIMRFTVNDHMSMVASLQYE